MFWSHRESHRHWISTWKSICLRSRSTWLSLRKKCPCVCLTVYFFYFYFICNKIKYNKIKVITLKLDNANQQKENNPKSRHKNLRPTCSHSVVPKKYQAERDTIYTEDLVETPCTPCACCSSVCEFIWALLGWFRGICSPGVLYPYWLKHFLWSPLSSEGKDLKETFKVVC